MVAAIAWEFFHIGSYESLKDGRIAAFAIVIGEWKHETNLVSAPNLNAKRKRLPLESTIRTIWRAVTAGIRLAQEELDQGSEDRGLYTGRKHR